MAWWEGVERQWDLQWALPQHQARRKGQVRNQVRGGGSRGTDEVGIVVKLCWDVVFP